MLVVALILVAFVINLGYILLVKGELQKASDSAALAGASQILVAQSSSSSLIDSRASSDIAFAISEAKKYCLKNSARVANLTLLDSDIVVAKFRNRSRFAHSGGVTDATWLSASLNLAVAQCGNSKIPIDRCFTYDRLTPADHFLRRFG